MTLNTKDSVANADLSKLKTNELTSRRIWPLHGPDNQEQWTTDVCIQQIINPPGQPRSRNFLRTTGLIGGPDTSDNNDPESFHCAMGSILSVAQFFGILPVHGIRSDSPRKLVYKMFSVRTIYAAAIMVMLFIITAVSVLHMIQALRADSFALQGGIGAATAGVIFYGNGLFGTILFARLAPRWIPLQREWRAMERFLNSDKYQGPRLRWKLSIIMGIVMTFALIEHVLSVVNNTPPNFLSSSSNSTFGEFLRGYCERSHAFILSITGYSHGIGIFLFCISKIGTFTWNFTDIFVMLLSVGLADRYKTLNQRLMEKKSSHRRNVNWRELREGYAILSSLVKNVDNNISAIILLSFANNLYFICLQLLNGLSPGELNIIGTIYFFGSFAFLVGRTVAVTLLAARIHDQSKLALPALYNCPGSTYNLETQRLQQQLTTDDVCLTGLRFFSITRNFMLAVAGAIVTYEVVLLQFNDSMKKG